MTAMENVKSFSTNVAYGCLDYVEAASDALGNGLTNFGPVVAGAAALEAVFYREMVVAKNIPCKNLALPFVGRILSTTSPLSGVQLDCTKLENNEASYQAYQWVLAMGIVMATPVASLTCFKVRDFAHELKARLTSLSNQTPAPTV